MDMLRQYFAALDLTHLMLEAARIQDWETLTQIEIKRAKIVADAVRSVEPSLATEKYRIAEIITEMERESADIRERVECWQEHAKILLRIKEPVS